MLVRYIRARLARIGDRFAEPEVVADTLAMYRELWVSLYKIDREFDPAFENADPS